MTDEIEAKASRSSGLRILAYVLLGVVILVGLAGGAITWFTWSAINRIEEAGFTRLQSANEVTIEGELTERGYYWAGTARVNGNVKNDLGLLVRLGVISGHIEGDLIFWGNELVIEEGAKIDGNVEIWAAYKVIVEGDVGGEIIGDYAVGNEPR